MAKQQQMQMPGVFGGLMRYDEEYSSRFMLSPGQVIGIIVALVVLVILLKTFFPAVIPTAPVSGVDPVGLILSSLLG